MAELAQETKDAIEQVKENATRGWHDFMSGVLLDVAKANAEFTSDDVWEEYERRENRPETHDNRAYGPVVIEAVKAGLMEKTERAVGSRRRNCHNMNIRVWRSKVYAAQ